MPPRSSITEKDIIVAYNNLQGITKVSESLHVDYRRVKRALINNGIPVKCHRTRKHSVNHSAFSELTPDACYWIGMLFADGYINKKREGRGIRYRINPELSLRHDTHWEIAIGDFLKALGWRRRRRRTATRTPEGEHSQVEA